MTTNNNNQRLQTQLNNSAGQLAPNTLSNNDRLQARIGTSYQAPALPKPRLQE